MFSWPFRDYPYPWLQVAELLNGIWHFGKIQKMLPYAVLVNRCSLMGPSYCTTEQNIFQTRIWVFQKCLVSRSSKADFTLGRHLRRCSSPAKSFLEENPEEPRKKCLLGLPRRWGPWQPRVWIHAVLEQEAFTSWGVYGAFHLFGGLLSHVALHSIRKYSGLCSGLVALPFQSCRRITAAAIFIMTCALYAPLKYLGTEGTVFFCYIDTNK